MTSNFCEIEAAIALTEIKLLERSDEILPNLPTPPSLDEGEDLKYPIMNRFHAINKYETIQ